jgi:hypothetical protein
VPQPSAHCELGFPFLFFMCFTQLQINSVIVTATFSSNCLFYAIDVPCSNFGTTLEGLIKIIRTHIRSANRSRDGFDSTYIDGWKQFSSRVTASLACRTRRLYYVSAPELRAIRVYIACDQALPISSEGARECMHCIRALEGRSEVKGEAACISVYLYRSRHQSTRQRIGSSTASTWSGGT